MVNEKRVERKLPLLITDGPWWSNELDRNLYRVQQFKKREPKLFLQHRNKLIVDLEQLKLDVDRSMNGNSKKK